MNAKHQKELDDLKAKMEREAELSKMNENDRIKAELEDLRAKNQKYEDDIALNIQSVLVRPSSKRSSNIRRKSCRTENLSSKQERMERKCR